MIRILTLAAAAAALIAAPASAQDIHIATAGKSPQQLHAEIAKAARLVCRDAIPGAAMLTVYVACERAATKNALAQLNGSTMAANASTTVAER